MSIYKVPTVIPMVSKRARRSSVIAISLGMSLMVGCGAHTYTGPSTSTTSTTTPTNAAGNITGNWQASTTPTAGPSLGTLSGSIDQSGGVTSSGQFTTSVLRVSSACYASSPSVPLQGFVAGSAVTLNSFAVNEQYLVLTATLNSAGVLQTGTYAVHGGCGDGSTGTFSATRFSALTGTYSGSVGTQGTSARSISLTTTQAGDGDGAGGFTITGTATFTGFSCFTSGTIQSSGNVSGSYLNLAFMTNDVQGGQISITGIIDPGADTITSATYKITGGACDGQTGSGTLKSS